MQHMEKYATYSIAGAAVAVLGLASLAAAQTTTSPLPEATTTPETAVPTAGQYPAPMVVDIDNAGNALVRGVVQSAGADSITLTSWGGTWTVQMAEGGSVVPAGTGGTGDLSSIPVGDFVGVDGTVTADQTMTVNATFVRDWTTDPYTGPAAFTAPAQAPETGTGDTGPTFTPSGGTDLNTQNGTLDTTNTDLDATESDANDESNDIDTTDDENATDDSTEDNGTLESTTTEDDTDNSTNSTDENSIFNTGGTNMNTFTPSGGSLY